MDWHARFLQQAGWTHDLRVYLFERARLTKARAVLEVGCGTGAIIADISTSDTSIHGLDIASSRLANAKGYASNALLTCGDALHLPYRDASFDITFCHYLLLWVKDPLKVLMEMRRVTPPGGSVLALAEPDFGSRVEKPDFLAPLGWWQTESLRLQGANPGIGAQLAELFTEAGIRLIETGPIQASVQGVHLTEQEHELEWDVMESDLKELVSNEEIHRMKILEEQAWRAGTRIMSVPTYFAFGMV